MRHAWFLCSLALAGVLASAPAQAHKPSDSYLSITVDAAAGDRAVSGRWDIALRDLDFAIGLDADGDGRITWGEVKAHHAEIAAYAAAHFALAADGRPCQLSFGQQAVDDHTDGAYTVLPMAFACADLPPGGPVALTIDYRLFADVDPQHRGLLNLSVAGSSGLAATRTAIFGPQAAQQTFQLGETRLLRQLLDYLREGVWHIWVGLDHVLFLLSLLLPAVGVWVVLKPARSTPRGAKPALRTPPRLHWQPVSRFREAFWDVLQIVTAFTVAHSITLSLAVLGVVSLSSRVVEASIAASVVLAALNNVWPVFHGRRWMVAFTFGLLHGFGFASVLVDLGLPPGALALALLGFNLGVEVGQLSVVVAFLPVAYAMRRGWFYRRVVLTGGSLVIAVLAAIWFVERAFLIKLWP
ncbi:MAG: HupE/UreJ family protein [Pseudomonadota bacterium]|nr:HupE/UreJ family protein [Pseudomonadota bacterium]